MEQQIVDSLNHFLAMLIIPSRVISFLFCMLRKLKTFKPLEALKTKFIFQRHLVSAVCKKFKRNVFKFFFSQFLNVFNFFSYLSTANTSVRIFFLSNLENPKLWSLVFAKSYKAPNLEDKFSWEGAVSRKIFFLKILQYTRSILKLSWCNSKLTFVTLSELTWAFLNPSWKNEIKLERKGSTFGVMGTIKYFYIILLSKYFFKFRYTNT